MNKKSHTAAIRFTGPPANLKAVADIPLVKTANAYVIVAGRRYPLRINSDDKTINSLSFSMPDNTLPCEQEAEVIIGDFKCSATASIESRPKASIEPATITLKAPAGDTVTTTLRVTNCGNSSLTLDSDQAVTVRESGKLGSNIAKALKQRDRDIADRLISLGELMDTAQRHELSVAASMSPATLAVDKSTKVTVELGIPEDIDADTTWTGSFAVLGTRLRVRVEPTPPGR